MPPLLAEAGASQICLDYRGVSETPASGVLWDRGGGARYKGLLGSGLDFTDRQGREATASLSSALEGKC